jgi:hypothetical protein
MAKVHPTTRHQTCQNSKGLCTLDAAENHVEITMGKNDTSTVQHSGIGEFGWIH